LWSSRFCLPTLCLWILLGLAIGCGHKKPPTPPASKIPARTTDLKVQQRGRELLLTLTYPSTTLGGLAIDSLVGIEIRELKRIVPSFLAAPEGEGEAPSGEPEETPPTPEEDTAAEESASAGVPELEGGAAQGEPEEDVEAAPEGDEEPMQSLMFRFPRDGASETTESQSKEDLVPVNAVEFKELAGIVRTVQDPELNAAVSGSQLILRLPLSEIRAEEDEVYIYAVQTLAGRRRKSGLSNLVKIAPRQPPPAPESIEVTAQATGVRIAWSPTEVALGYRVYRRDAKSREYGEPIYSPSGDFDSHLDTGIVFGRRYIYTVTAVSSERPLVESAIAAEYEIDYQDRFPPPVPGALVALPEDGRVRLLWEPSAAADLAGYRILRRESGGEVEAINTDPVIGQDYLDHDVVSGRSYLYSIEAVDQKGNRSQPSEEIQVRVP
jgi:hypothetical protein